MAQLLPSFVPLMNNWIDLLQLPHHLTTERQRHGVHYFFSVTHWFVIAISYGSRYLMQGIQPAKNETGNSEGDVDHRYKGKETKIGQCSRKLHWPIKDPDMLDSPEGILYNWEPRFRGVVISPIRVST
jgi:hypothetical protein